VHTEYSTCESGMNQERDDSEGIQLIELIFVQEIEWWNLLQLIQVGQDSVKGDRWWGQSNWWTIQVYSELSKWVPTVQQKPLIKE
jgi:hypothetical protein